MMKNELLIPKNILFALIAFGFLFNFSALSFDFEKMGIPLEVSNVLISLGLISSFIETVILIVDVFKNNAPGKYLWTLGFLIFAPLFGFFYVRNRENYLGIS